MCPQIDTEQDTRQRGFSPLGKFYIFHVNVMYTPCSKLSFSTNHVNWQLRLGDN